MLKFLAKLILIGDSRPGIFERISYGLTILATCGPVAYFLNELSLWFDSNRQFVRFVMIALLLNIVVGWVYHKKMKTFSWELFLRRNSVMILVIVIVYTLLEQLRLTAGDNWAGETFRVVIQMATLLYPTSKVLKNIYILSDKQHPPAFVMEKLYNFEKTGNLKQLFDAGQDGAATPAENNNPDNLE